MNVLLISEVCFPSTFVGAFRVEKVARALAAAGHSVHIVHMEGGPVDGAQSAISSCKVSPWPTPRDLLLRGRRMLPRRHQPARSAPALTPNAAGAESQASRSRVARTAIALLNVPDDRQGFIPAAVRAAKHPSRGPYDLIYSSAPAFSAHVAARWLRRALDIPWVAEFRDPWRQNAIPSAKNESRLARRLDSALELSCLAAADRIVAVSPGAAAQFRDRLPPAGREKVLLVHNGIDNLAIGREPSKTNVVRVLFAGALYPPRDPAPLIEPLLRARTSGVIDRPLELLFLGKVDFALEPRLSAAIAALPADCTVRTLPWMDKPAAEQLIRDADLLILPAQRLVMQIPNKLYDYLGSRVPIFAASERGSDVATLLERAGDHFVFYPDMSAAEIDALAARALTTAARRTTSGEYGYLDSLRADRQMAALVEVVASMAPSPRLR